MSSLPLLVPPWPAQLPAERAWCCVRCGRDETRARLRGLAVLERATPVQALWPTSREQQAGFRLCGYCYLMVAKVWELGTYDVPLVLHPRDSLVSLSCDWPGCEVTGTWPAEGWQRVTRAQSVEVTDLCPEHGRMLGTFLSKEKG